MLFIEIRRLIIGRELLSSIGNVPKEYPIRYGMYELIIIVLIFIISIFETITNYKNIKATGKNTNSSVNKALI